MAINDALGRNNIPVELVNAILEFRGTMLRMKQLAAQGAIEKGIDPTRNLLDISEKVADAYRNRFKENSIHTADFACDLLSIKRRSLTSADVDFMREYFKCSTFPERDANESIVRFLEGADTFDSQSILREAAAGNIVNLDTADCRRLLQEMEANPILRPDQLKAIGSHVAEKMRGPLVDPVYKNLANLVADHLFLTDTGNFYSTADTVKLRIHGITRENLQEVLNTLNSLRSYDEVVAYFRTMMDDSSQRLITPAMASKYCKKRFGTDYA